MKAINVSMLKESCCALVLCTIIAGSAKADTQADEWWNGDWNCDIGGHPARMKWSVVEDAQAPGSAGGGGATAARWEGSLYSDSAAQPVALTEPSMGKKGGLYFRHADGHKWYLQKPVDNKATGWTRATAQRNAPRYPIACWR